jgi:thioredoxin:protein disulfide reductase
VTLSSLGGKSAKAALLLLAFFSLVAAPVGERLAYAQNDAFDVPLEKLTKKSPENVVRFLVTQVGDLTKPQAKVELRLQTRDGFKIYNKGLEFTYSGLGAAGEILSSTSSPNPKRILDPFYNEERDVHESNTVFSVALPAGATADGILTVKFEACSVSMCLLPTHFELALIQGARGIPRKKSSGLDLGVAPPSQSSSSQQTKPTLGEGNFIGDPIASGEKLPVPTVAEPIPSAPVDSSLSQSWTDQASLWVQEALQNRSWFLFPALFLAGLLMNLTPCVYPMIPITLNVMSQFGSHTGLGKGVPEEEKKRRLRRRRLLPLVYVLGMVLSYSLMGVAAAMTGTLFGSLLQNPIVNATLAVVMFLLGLSMLGVFNMTALQNLATKIPIAENNPFFGVLTMGAVSGLVSAPCTGPVLSTILLLIGQSRDPIYGFVLMFFMALGFGAPYLVLGAFTQNMNRLPKAGGALTTVKYLFAALMFALALTYLKPLVSSLDYVRWIYARPSATGAMIALLLGVVAILIARVQPSLGKLSRAALVCVLTAFALWLTLFVTSNFVVLNTKENSSSTDSSPKASQDQSNKKQASLVRWESDWNKAKIRADVEKKPLVVDAWAEWCAACLKMDETVWKDERVVKLLNNDFIAVKLDFTRSSPLMEEFVKVWDIVGLPAVGFFSTGANLAQAPQILFREAITAEQFLLSSQRILSASKEGQTP